MKAKALVLIIVASLLWATVALAAPPEPKEELIFLADTRLKGDGVTQLFKVNIGLDEQRADLVPLPNGAIPFDTVLSLALSLDNQRLYAIDVKTKSSPARLGYYDLATETWQEIGALSAEGQIRGIVQLAMMPDGSLLMGAGSTDSLYTVDADTANATLIGKVINVTTGATVNIQGGDLVRADRRTYIWANASRKGARRGLYRIVQIADDKVYVKWNGMDKQLSEFVTGLAVRFGGAGKLVGSTTSTDCIFVYPRGPKVRAAKLLPMFLNGERYELYASGDMTSNQ